MTKGSPSSRRGVPSAESGERGSHEAAEPEKGEAEAGQRAASWLLPTPVPYFYRFHFLRPGQQPAQMIMVVIMLKGVTSLASHDIHFHETKQ